jgi:DNA polymerase-3 subunit gamma/tau
MFPVPYLSLYRKYRPQTFEELLGQEAVSGTLARAISDGRVAHAYLFTGPRGTGKTSTARILAKALNCVHGPTPTPCGECESCVAIAEGSSLDVMEMDAASHSKVDETREILAGVPLVTAGGRRKVYVIDEVHMLSTPSFNALLKTLEEPPEHVLFILATTEAHKVLPTIISRTQRFDFRRVPAELLQDHLARIAKLEGIDADPDALAIVARHADGGVRDAVSMLDQLAALGGPVSATDVERMLVERREDAFAKLFEALADGAIGEVFGTLGALLREGADARQLAVGALGHARSLLVLLTAADAEGLLELPVEDLPKLGEQAQRFTPADLLRILDLLGRSLSEMRNVPNHRLLLELALVRAAAPDTDPSANGLLGRIERLERRMGIEERETPPVPATPEATPTPAPTRASPSPAAATATPAPPPPGSQPAERDTSLEPSSGADHVGLGHVREAWPAVLRAVNQRSKRVWGLLSPSQAASFEGELLTVEVQADFHQSTMSEARNRDLLADALHAALGIRPSLSFVAARPRPPQSQGVEEDHAEAAAVEVSSEDPVELVKRGLAAEVVEEEA